MNLKSSERVLAAETTRRAKKTKDEEGQSPEETQTKEGNASYLSQKIQFNGSSRAGQDVGDWGAKNEKTAGRNARNGTA